MNNDSSRKDYYYKKAKIGKYRSRAAYKLKEIDYKFHIFKKGDIALDLGAAPGGWSQDACEKIGTDGFIIAVDLNRIKNHQYILKHYESQKY